MPAVSLDRKTALGVKAIRVLAGMAGHRPSAKNACVGAKMDPMTFAKPEVGTGGMRNEAVHRAFIRTLNECGWKLSDSTKKRWGV